MAKMYVANLTRQAQDFIYRLPETRKSTFQQIPVGGQVLLSGDLTTKDIEAVIQQHAPYGMVPAAEVAKRREFNGLCFALDRPVPIEALRRGLEANRAVLDARGVELRRQAAIAVNNLTQDADPDVAAVKAAVAAVANRTPFVGRLYASRVHDAIHGYLGADASVGPIDMFGRIRRPDGSTAYVRDGDVLTVPDEPAGMVSPKTVQFFLAPEDVGVTVVADVPAAL